MDVHQYTLEEVREITNNFDTQIGSGGFAIVYKGTINREEYNEETVAVKVYQTTNTTIKQFNDERDGLSQFRHQNIVKLKGYAEDQGLLILVMEHFPTPLNAALIKNLNWEATLKIMKETASALEYIHGFGDGSYIYIDFKPDNVMLNKENRAKLIDLGSIMKKGNYTKSYSKAYAAPEVLHGVTKPTQKADVYSFGIVMLQLMMKLDSVEDAADSSNKMGGKKVKEASSSRGNRGKNESPIVTAAKEAFNKGSYYVNKDLVGLKKKCREDVAIQITELALDCTRLGANVRPTMEEVVRRLNEF